MTSNVDGCPGHTESGVANNDNMPSAPPVICIVIESVDVQPELWSVISKKNFVVPPSSFVSGSRMVATIRESSGCHSKLKGPGLPLIIACKVVLVPKGIFVASAVSVDDGLWSTIIS
ncbi:MAG: hypothetical protein QM503_02715 [Bacteroidota bacterium]